MTNIKKMAILPMSMQGLRDLLQLPREAEIVRIEMEPGYRASLRLVVEGVGWDTSEGAPIMPAPTAMVHQTTDAAGNICKRVDWNLPSDAPDFAALITQRDELFEGQTVFMIGNFLAISTTNPENPDVMTEVRAVLVDMATRIYRGDFPKDMAANNEITGQSTVGEISNDLHALVAEQQVATTGSKIH